MNPSRSTPPPMPFGYSFQGFQDAPAPPPPAPAPGPALLDDNETDMLDTFFDRINAGQMDNNNYFLQDIAQNKPDGAWDPWVDENPPMFHGSTTSLVPPITQPALPPRGAPTDIYDFNQNPTYSSNLHVSTTSPEVLAAASTLLHNGQNTHCRGTTSDYRLQTLDRTSQPQIGYRGETAFGNESTRAFGHPPARRAGSISSTSKLPDEVVMNEHTVLRDMLYGTNMPQNAQQNNTPKAADLRWGSDASFFEHGFVAPPNQESVKEVTNTMLTSMVCLEPQTSATNTQPSSPKVERRKRPNNIADPGPQISTRNGFEVRDLEGLQDYPADSRPKKRRKGKARVEMKHEEEDEQPPETTHRRTKLRRSSSSRISRAKLQLNFEEGQLKQARSPSGEQKSGRENLTDEQKRSNHILSEQKRRNLIKQGFDDLCELVPELKGGGFSKSAMLTQAADWMDDLLQGNEKLRAQLEELSDVNVM